MSISGAIDTFSAKLFCSQWRSASFIPPWLFLEWEIENTTFRQVSRIRGLCAHWSFIHFALHPGELLTGSSLEFRNFFNSHAIFQLAVLHYCFCIVFIVLSGKFAFLSCIFDFYLLGFKLTFVRCWSNVCAIQSTCSDGIFVPPTVTTNHLILKGFAASKYLIPSNCVLVYSVATRRILLWSLAKMS